MTSEKIAHRLVELCRQGQWEKAQNELYAEDVTSIEPQASAGFEKETHGLHAIIEKGHKFESMVEEAHSYVVSEPLIAGNSIAFTIRMDVTMKGQGRTVMDELCVYHVKNGKVVQEEFFI
jgi:SnoaL-like domain